MDRPACGRGDDGAADVPLRYRRLSRTYARKSFQGRFRSSTATTQDVVEATLFFAAAKTNAMAGQSLVVSHGWFME